jgi:hypothetical protein
MSSSNPSSEYAGDLTSDAAWALLKDDPKPSSSMCGPWRNGPSSACPICRAWGAKFTAWNGRASPAWRSIRISSARRRGVARAGAVADTPVLFLCRSGARSRAAAIAMTRAGFTRAYNIAGGFEGDMDQERHRGNRNGWKASGLPWRKAERRGSHGGWREVRPRAEVDGADRIDFKQERGDRMPNAATDNKKARER